MDFGKMEGNYLCAEGWTGGNRLEWLRKIVFWRVDFQAFARMPGSQAHLPRDRLNLGCAMPRLSCRDRPGLGGVSQRSAFHYESNAPGHAQIWAVSTHESTMPIFLQTCSQRHCLEGQCNVISSHLNFALRTMTTLKTDHVAC
jgi:hypothetical protein